VNLYYKTGHFFHSVYMHKNTVFHWTFSTVCNRSQCYIWATGCAILDKNNGGFKITLLNFIAGPDSLIYKSDGLLIQG